MDRIAKKILCALDVNCRVPLSRLAKDLRLSRNVVAYRIQKLEKEGVITKYICSVNLGLLGYKTYKVYFKILNARSGLEGDFVEFLLKDKQVIHALKTEGAFDYSATLAVQSIRELDDFLIRLKSQFKELVVDYWVSILVYSKVFKLNKWLLGEKKEWPKMERYSGEGKTEAIDEEDKKILRELSQGANTPMVELARKTKLSLDVVKYRLKKLSKSMVNAYRVMLNLNKLGVYHYVVMLRVRQASHQDEERLVSWCALKSNVMYCSKRIGYFDFEINAAITDINDLNEFMTELKQEFSTIIGSYETMINSKLLKLNYVPF
ncbi:MAG: Lrp/AsnC family transcriptional regulator [Nanoarchaeota archaeon]